MELNSKIRDIIARYKASGIEQQVDYEKFYLYSVITHSTAIEGSTITEVENQLLFDEGISPQGKSLMEQLMNVDLEKQLTIFAEDIDVTDDVTDKTHNVTDTVTDKISDTQCRILDILEQMPDISQSRLAEMIGLHRVNINRNIRQMVSKGILTRVGSDRKGYWKINRFQKKND